MRHSSLSAQACWAAAPLPVLAALLRLTVPARRRVTKQHRRNLDSIGPNKSGQSLLPMVAQSTFPSARCRLGQRRCVQAPDTRPCSGPPLPLTAFQVAQVKPQGVRPDSSPSHQLKGASGWRLDESKVADGQLRLATAVPLHHRDIARLRSSALPRQQHHPSGHHHPPTQQPPGPDPHAPHTSGVLRPGARGSLADGGGDDGGARLRRRGRRGRLDESARAGGAGGKRQ